MFFSVMERETGKAMLIEANDQSQAEKYYKLDKYVIVPTEEPKNAKEYRVNGRIRESIDPKENIAKARYKVQSIETVFVMDGSGIIRSMK